MINEHILCKIAVQTSKEQRNKGYTYCIILPIINCYQQTKVLTRCIVNIIKHESNLISTEQPFAEFFAGIPKR